MKKLIKRLLLASLLVIISLAGALTWYAVRPHAPEALPLTVKVVPGTHFKRLAHDLAAVDAIDNPLAFRVLARALGRGGAIKVGVYTLDRPLTPLQMLDKFERGEVAPLSVQFIEGWNLRQVRAALAAQPYLRQDSARLSEPELAQTLGAEREALEGLFFPDTYFYAPYSSDLDVLRRAYRLQQQKLEAAWATRMPDLPYRTPYEALIMASIVEKETGAAFERALIAGVFINRTRIGMRLQTDPTVIYGLGENFDGNLRRIDLQTDTPYNTYTRAGLPPTPIAMPGEAAIRAALNPQKTDAFYFVSRGDGTHVFSRTLDEHNRAVNRYQRGGRQR